MTKSNKIQIHRGAVREAAKVDGKWVLETNDDTLRLEDAAEGYKGLMVIERCFCYLKRTQIKVTPLCHWLPRRVEAHVEVWVAMTFLSIIPLLWASLNRSQASGGSSSANPSTFESRLGLSV